MTMRTRETDLAWAVGFIDGEACIRIGRNRSRGRVNPIYRLEVAISQNVRSTLEHCQRVIGLKSSICLMPPQSGQRRRSHLLTYSCAAARDMLQLVQPYLVRKKAEATLGLDFAKRVQSRRGGRTPHSPEEIAIRDAYYRAMQHLK
ncbi:MAG: hypothetical protein NVS1B6_13490 [Steroidobacteraceae bacterium]